MRIAIAQINPRLADFEYNKQKILEFINKAYDKKSELIIFPEASLFGYHPFDLLEREQLVSEQLKTLNEILKKIPKKTYILIGGFSKNKNKKGRPYFNSAFLCTKNKIVKIFSKELLPTGDVFDEARFIEKGNLKNNYFKINGKNFYLTICEDIWAWEDKSKRSLYPENPLKKVPRKKMDLVINMSASPFYINKMNRRKYMVQATAKYFKAPMIYVNMVGAQDEIIYDGQSFLTDQKGKIKFSLRAFEEDLNVFDLDTLESWNPNVSRKISTAEQIRKALVLGVKDFCLKTGLNQVHVGISGGIDSAVVACLAVDALGPQNVKLFALPTEFNSEESYESAFKLAKNLHVEMKMISIQSLYETIKHLLDKNLQIEQFSVVHENMQARIRGLILMGYSNQTGSLLLTTGNKSEYATGYATLYGDMCGGLAVLGDLLKREVYQLANLYNDQHEVIPKYIITRPPSAELRPNQKDQDSLPPYDELDQAVENIVEKNNAVKTKTEKWLVPRLMKSEFKRWQAAPILKISEHAFGRGRRYPIAHRADKI